MSGNPPPELARSEYILSPQFTMRRRELIAGQAILVKDGKFVEIDGAEEVFKRYPRHAVVDLPKKMVMPGFIDAHHHLTQSFGKALSFGEPTEMYRRIWLPINKIADDDFFYIAAKLAALESLRGGFTTIVDAGMREQSHLSSIAAAVRDVGLRCILTYVCNDAGLVGTTTNYKDIIENALTHIRRYEHDLLIRPSLSVSVPEAGSVDMLREVAKICSEAGAVFQTHVNEHLSIVERSVLRHGMRPLEYLDHIGVLGPNVLVGHAALLTATECKLLLESDTAVAYNPVASQWRGTAVAPAAMFAALGIRFGIGTDGTRSDAFRLIDAAEAAQRFTSMQAGDFSFGAGWTWLDHGTTAGAAAVGLEAVTGAIEPEREADYLIVDIDVPEMTPTWDLPWELVRIACRDQILGVAVGGRLRLWRGWPTDWDAGALMQSVSRAAARIVQRAAIDRVRRPTGSRP
ncbi:MAG: amidohydrolase family protein [Rhizobiaceae bacterium]